MIDFKPIYRGKEAELKAQENEAREWIIAQCRDAIADFPDDEKDILLREINQPSNEWNKVFHMVITRSWSVTGFYTGRRREEYKDFFYKWHIGKNIHGHHGGQKVLLRKDGSIHAENLKTALKIWVEIHKKDKRQKSIEDANQAFYEEIQSPGKHLDGVYIKLSKDHLGKCSIKFIDKENHIVLGPIEGIAIMDIAQKLNSMRMIAQNFTELMEG